MRTSPRLTPLATFTGATTMHIEPLAHEGEYHITVQHHDGRVVTNTITREGDVWNAHIDTGQHVIDHTHQTHHDAIYAVTRALYQTLARNHPLPT